MADYEYSPDGLREVKRGNSGTIHYVFEGTEPIFEKRISDGKIKSYVYALGKHLARVDGVIGDTSAKVYYYHTDHLESIRAVTDSSGNVVWKADYFAFGTQFSKNKIDPNFEEDDVAFAGKGYDGDTGLYYFNARWYDSDTGRFISEDPVGDPNNPNLYSYCANNPLAWIDPTGCISQEDAMSQAAANTTTHAEGSTDSFTTLSGNTITGTYGINNNFSSITVSKNGNVTSQTNYNPDGSSTNYKFDTNGKLKTSTDYDKDGKMKEQATYYSNGKKRSDTVYGKDGLIDVFASYDKNGYLKSLILGNQKDIKNSKEAQTLLNRIKEQLKEEINKLKEEYTDPKELANKVKEEVCKKIGKSALSALASKLGLETISKLTNVTTGAAFSYETGMPRVVGYAAGGIGAAPTVGISVLVSFVWDMISPEPCY